MSCNSLTVLPNWIILTTFWLSVLQHTLRPDKWTSKGASANLIAASSLQVEDFWDSSVDQFLWETKLEPWTNAPQPLISVSENKTLDGTKGVGQNKTPFKVFELSLQKWSSCLPWPCTKTKEFHECRELKIRYKYLAIIWETFPQLEVIEIIWPTIEAIVLTWIKADCSKLAKMAFSSEQSFFDPGIGGENKTGVGVNFVINPWKFILGLPVWFFVINFKSASRKVRTQ